VLPNLIQSVSASSNGLAKQDSSTKSGGQAPDTFANALERQRSSDHGLITKTELASSSSQLDPKGKKPVQNWTNSATTAKLLAIPIVAAPAEVADSALASNVGNGPTPSVGKAAHQGENCGSKLPSLDSRLSPATLARATGFRSMATASNSGAPTQPKEALIAGPPSSYAVPTNSNDTALATSLGAGAPQAHTPAMSDTSEDAALSSRSFAIESKTDSSLARVFDAGVKVQPSPAPPTGLPVSFAAATSARLSGPNLENSGQDSVVQLGSPSFDSNVATLQDTPQADVSVLNNNPPTQPIFAASAPDSEQQAGVLPPTFGSVGSRAKTAFASAQQFSAEPATSIHQHAATSAVVPYQTFSTHGDAVMVPKPARGQETKSATLNQTRDPNPDSQQPASLEAVSVASFHGVPPRALFAAPVAAPVDAPNVASLDREKNSLQPTLLSDEGPSPTTIAGVHTETTQTDNAQPPIPSPPIIPKSPQTVEEQPRAVVASNLIIDVPKSQPLASDQGQTPREVGKQSVHGTGEPLPVEMTSAPVMAARMAEGASQSEVHLGLRTQAFGTVDVHTGLRDTQLGVSISSERGDLRSFLSPEIPALQSVLRQHDVHFENIHFAEHGAASPTFSGNADSHSQPFSHGQPSSGQGHSVSLRLPLDNAKQETSTPQGISLEMAMRLNVHA
jgi:hypothetical protein